MTTITTNIELILDRLKQGDVVAIPTETVYGLAADATNEQAIKKIFSIKKRPLNHPLIMHICHDWDLNQWVTDIPDYAQKMMDSFWPGPLTLVLNSKENAVNALINAKQNSIAIRAPKHHLTQQILRKLNRPLVAPSANPFGQISPTTALHVAHSFPNEDFLILDGGRCNVGIESTIVQATDRTGYSLLRPGMIDQQTIEDGFATQHTSNTLSPKVSGQLDSHYKPQKKLYYIDNWEQFENHSHLLYGKIYSMSISKKIPKKTMYHHQLPNDELAVAYQLYNELRYADQSKADAIVIELPPNEIRWHAIREKIIKAGQQINSI